MRVCVYVFHAFSHARPCSPTSSPTFRRVCNLPTSSPTFRRVCNCPRPHPRSGGFAIHPRPHQHSCGFAIHPRPHPRSGGFATRLLPFAGLQPAMLVLFTSPGRRPGHGRWRVANPPERGCLRGYLRGCLLFGGCVFACLFVKDFCQSCRGKGLQANPLTHKRIRKRPVMQCKTGRLGLPDRPFWRAKEAVWHGHTAGMARRAARCKNFSRCGRRGGRGASSLRQYDAVQAMPAAITRSRMALSCSGVALRSSRSGVSRSMVYIITLPGAMYLTFSSHGPT